MAINKLVGSFADAVRDIPNGATIMVAGFGGAGFPLNLVKALRDHGARDLTIIANTCGGVRPNTDVGLLFQASLVKKAIVSVGVASGFTAPAVEEQYAKGALEIEFVPQGTLAERIRAGGAGIGGFYTRTGLGTELAKGKEVKDLSGDDYLLELPLTADFALLKAYRSDTSGNLVYRRVARNYNPIMAAAASVTIVEAEKVVPPEALDPELIGTPGVYVDRIVGPKERNERTT